VEHRSGATRSCAELGYFDEDLFAYYEDVDLSFRANLAGYECWYAPKAVVYHAGGGTSRQQASEFAYYHAVRNRWSMIVKNGPAGLLLRSFPRIFFAEMLSLAKAVTERKTILTLKAHRTCCGVTRLDSTAKRSARDAQDQQQGAEALDEAPAIRRSEIESEKRRRTSFGRARHERDRTEISRGR